MPTSDIIVIGGGIAGISAASALSNAAKVVVLEAEKSIGYHATGRSAAIYIKNYGNATLRALNARSEAPLSAPSLPVEAPILTPRGELLIAQPDELDVFEDYFQDSDGLERLSPRQAHDLVPILKTDMFCAAVYEPKAQDIDVDLLLAGYARHARSNGADIITNATVQQMRYDGCFWTIETTNGTYQAKIVINAAGAWGDHIAEIAGVTPLGLRPLRRSAVLMSLPNHLPCENWPLFGSITEQWYAKPMGGKLMISPADEDPVQAQDVFPDDMTLAEGLWRFEQATTAPIARPSHSWAGLRTFLPDRTPAVGFDANSDGFFWLVGQGGYGVQTSPAMSELAADIILGNQPAIDQSHIAALSPHRFSQ